MAAAAASVTSVFIPALHITFTFILHILHLPLHLHNVNPRMGGGTLI